MAGGGTRRRYTRGAFLHPEKAQRTFVDVEATDLRKRVADLDSEVGAALDAAPRLA